MKKILLLVLAVLSLVTLTACGNETVLTEDENIERFEGVEVKEFEAIELPSGEKITEIYMEGMAVPVNYTALKSALGYTIQYDADLYGISREGNTDYYRSLDDMERIYFSIELLSVDFDSLSGETLDNKYGYENKYFGLIDGKPSTADSPFSWDSEVVDTDYIKAEGRVYKIERHYYMEATEGAGISMANMVGTFKVLKDM
ncbi:MAG: hypothetical protein IKJ32_04800 [Clostridia bacterium]|nr:hypothetical protein [Clostridia bacterium]